MASSSDRLVAALHEHGMAYGELGRRFGAAIGLHVTDAIALVEILSAHERGVPLTQSALARRVGLTPGAMSSLINRLEGAGRIRRVRDTADRRVVTLHAGDNVDAPLERFFTPLADRMAEVMNRYPPEALAEFTRLLTDVCQTMDAYAEQLDTRGTAQT
ncbi:MarR family transcriptional regulator [Actinoplanes sp. TRM 88003]|uniref:MarR family transcriptional regulator n=1 Tax=Paractinoplanes aksuensis TaxID=2939490 RepID=A0ABT1DVZ5_9ACTN|nr:MarR family transcriptional regulator [Actinoplanes aksuensis]MCO8274950.1 MarR family transcriptional regulator [Actinoplanes aksuensis]